MDVNLQLGELRDQVNTIAQDLGDFIRAQEAEPDAGDV
jgi:hypothetical protein